MNGLLKLKTSTRLMSAMAFAISIVVGASGSAGADTVKLRGAHIFPETLTQSGPNFEEFGKLLEERSDGQLKVKIIHGGALLSPKDHLDGTESGLVDLVSFYPIYFPGEFRVEGALTNILDIWSEEVPDLTGVSIIHAKMYEEFDVFREEYKKRNMMLLVPLPSDQYVIACKDEVATLDDLKGKKMRSFGKYFPILQKGLGVEPVNIPISEAYTALGTGVVDCVYTSPDYMLSAHIYEVAPNLLIPATDIARPQMFASGTISMNADSYNRLSDELKKVVDEVSVEMRKRAGARMAKVYDHAISSLVEKGKGKLNKMSEEDLETWRANVPTLRDEIAADLTKNGYPGEEIFSRYSELAAEYKAGNLGN